ncbi:MAG: ATP-binding protein [Flavobacteriales bacterium]|nr:ATP-binding protein [Flavobacteriales bacterium]
MYKGLLQLSLTLLISYLGIQISYTQTTSHFEMSYFEDVNSSHSIESVQEEKFQLAPERIINLGITKSTLWVKIKLNTKNLSPEAVLEVTNAFFDNIILFYTLKNKKLIQDTLGILYPHSKNKLKHYLPAFVVPTDELDSPIVFFKIESRWSMLVQLKAKTKENFYKERVTSYLIAGLLIGGLLLMGIYNLFLFFSTRDFSYFLYVLALFGAILSQGYIFGILIPYLSPESPEFSLRFPIIIMACTGLFSAWFTIRFLEIKNTSKFFYSLLISGIFFSLFSISLELLKFDDLSRKVNIIEVIGISCIIFSAACYSLIKGNKIALYFTIAWSFYLSGLIVFALKTIDLIPHNTFTRYFMMVGTFMEVLLLSFALGHKYYLVRVEKERLERQTRKELEILVKEQTAELENSLEEKGVLLKEVHHRVKNNLQIIISLLDLQVASIKDPKNKEVFTQSMSRIYSMSLIHQKLYQSDNLVRINIKGYLEELFTYVQNSYYSETQEITYQLSLDKVELALAKAVPLGLIVNELLSNSFKHGLRHKHKGQIKMSLEFKEKTMRLIVADSGLGFDEDGQELNVKKSLGLFLVKSLVKQLQATLIRYQNEGYFITELSIPIKE